MRDINHIHYYIIIINPTNLFGFPSNDWLGKRYKFY